MEDKELKLNNIEEDTFVIPKYKDLEYYVPVLNDLVRYKGITATSLKFYEVLLSFRNLKEIVIRESTIAEKLNCTKGYVSRQVNELKDMGLIEIVAKIGKSGRHNKYLIKTFDVWAKEKNVPCEKGFFFLLYVILYNKNLSANELRMYQIFKSFQRMESGIKPSISNLQEYTGLSRPTVIATISSLEEKKLIRIERNIEVGKGNTYNTYYINDEIEWYEANK